MHAMVAAKMPEQTEPYEIGVVAHYYHGGSDIYFIYGEGCG